jgi:hypothetical protein
MILIALVSTGSVGWTKTWYIAESGTGDAPTIQAGIDSAAVGDTVLVAAGMYTGPGNTNLDFGGKRMVLLSEFGPLVTMIDCGGLERGIHFHRREPQSARVEGFTIRNGYETYGGGIYCENASDPTIHACIFTGNRAYYDGGGIGCYDSSPTVTGCIFVGNTARNGGGISCEWHSLAVITNCTFSENAGGGVYADFSSPQINNCIISFSTQGRGIGCGLSSPTITCCNTFGNAGGDGLCAAAIDGGGNFSADPQFCGAPGTGNYCLQSDSPCAPGNHPDGDACGLIGALPVGCGHISTEKASWGIIKSMFR